ncbi:DUF2381 family protein [Archangium violaceum]|uniref:DUF2381 family protein n=1 Tax=Archangium violaceum TaxID=83451 RepID=UPI0019519D78|nr:DUF2381 family protein [Archangium violaceum]QRN92985.1 DUF2381 family protein [Archangium violaceum]
MLALVLLRGSPTVEPSAVGSCAEMQRIELSLSPETALEVCVSPGLMTGFLFDAPVVVELQDEVRFKEVVRGRQLLTLLPPPDMVPGERLRFVVHFGGGAAQQAITFTLVAHSGRATHQVEVFRDKRTRESFQQEVDQERAKNRQLREDNRRLRARFERERELGSIVANEAVGIHGIQAMELDPNAFAQLGGILYFDRGLSYRGDLTVAAELWLRNSSSEPWTAVGGTLVDSDGEELTGFKIRQGEAIVSDRTSAVIVEANAKRTQARGYLKLKLWDENLRVITLPRLMFP